MKSNLGDFKRIKKDYSLNYLLFQVPFFIVESPAPNWMGPVVKPSCLFSLGRGGQVPSTHLHFKTNCSIKWSSSFKGSCKCCIMYALCKGARPLKPQQQGKLMALFRQRRQLDVNGTDPLTNTCEDHWNKNVFVTFFPFSPPSVAANRHSATNCWL